MRWPDRFETVMVISEKRVGESVSACYASPFSSETLKARQRSWLIRCVQIYEGRLEAGSGSSLRACDRQWPTQSRSTTGLVLCRYLRK
jgi:hypothetical protein